MAAEVVLLSQAETQASWCCAWESAGSSYPPQPQVRVSQRDRAAARAVFSPLPSGQCDSTLVTGGHSPRGATVK